MRGRVAKTSILRRQLSQSRKGPAESEGDITSHFARNLPSIYPGYYDQGFLRMLSQERLERLLRAKALGRAAYRLARDGEIVGNVELEGASKRLTKYRRGLLLIDLWRPWRSDAFETEFSELRVSYAGKKVLELRWDRAESFAVVIFKPGLWEKQI
jgi:hypothetical protein